MRIVATLAAILLLAGAFPVQASGSVTVHFTVNASITFPYNEPAFTASCDVTVEDGADGSAVLDAAVAAGCIEGWSFTTHPTFGTFLTGIQQDGNADPTDAHDDGARFVCGAFPPPNPGGEVLFSSWGFGLNLGASPTGLDDYEASEDDAVSFHYLVDTCASAVTLAFAFTGVAPVSPVPVPGSCTTDPDC